MKAKIKNIVSTLIVAIAVLTTVPAMQVAAQEAGGQETGGDSCNSGFTIFPRWYDNGLCEDGQIVSPGEFGDDTASSFGKWAAILAMNIVSIILYAVGYVSLGFIIYGGFKYMTSGGSSSGIQSAQKTIINAVIGLVLSIMSVAIVTFVAGAIG